MSLDFWAGTALTIPLALIAWLIQRSLEPRLNAFGRRSIEKRNKDVEREYRLVASLMKDRDAIIEYVLSILLRIAVVDAFISLVSNSIGAAEMLIGYFVSQVWRGRYDIVYIVGIAQQVVSVALVMYVVRLASKGMTVYRRTKNFDAYQKEVVAKLGAVPEGA